MTTLYTKSVDGIFDNYGNTKRKIIKELNDINKLSPDDQNKIGSIATANTQESKISIDTIWSLFGIDQHCQCCMGNLSKIKIGKCQQCLNMYRLTDFKSSNFHIEVGSLVGQQLTIDTVKLNNKLSLQSDSQLAIACNDMGKIFEVCDGKIPRVSTFIASDPLTNEIINSWLTNDRANKIYTAFICRGIGYILHNKYYTIQQVFESKDANLIKKMDLTTLIIQLVALLTDLSEYSFVANDCNLMIEDELLEYNNRGIVIRSGVTLRLSNLSKSSCQIGSIRFGPHNITKQIILKHIFNTQRIRISKHNFNGSNTYAYVYQGNELDIIRSIGIPLFAKSYNFYSLLIQLLMNSNLYKTFVEDQLLFDVVTSLFTENDMILLLDRLSNTDKMSTSDILRGLYLRCDVLDYITTLFK